MKTMIINKTKLSMKKVGEIIDQIRNLPDDTHYYGQVQICTFNTPIGKVDVQIRYLKRYVEFLLKEVKK